MKALFIGSTRGTACSLYYFTSLVRLGVDVVPFDPDYFTPRSGLEKILFRLRRGPTQDRVEEVSQKLISLCRRNHFDFAFVMAENFFGVETIEAIRTLVRNPPLFLYHSHDNNFSAGICKPANFDETLKAHDFVFTTKSQNVERYKKIGQSRGFYVPSAFEPMVHHPVRDVDSRLLGKVVDVSFIGTYDCSRDPIFEKLGWEHLHIWGDFWRKSPHFGKHANRISPEAVFYFEFADIISHSRINLGLLREEAEDRHTQRTFEIPACGGFQVAPRNEEIASYFKDGEEIALFGSVEEMCDKVRFFLKNESVRQKIAKAGFERCLNGHHTYMDRVSQMLEIAGLKISQSTRSHASAEKVPEKVPVVF
ncbi:MAG: glycosyltransferase [Deltaproteobacteria bacterium]|nr:glycosyltransferase [Deltaproteobacteria bacterium]